MFSPTLHAIVALLFANQLIMSGLAQVDTGLVLLKETSTDCSDIFQTYMCTTTGDGATVITLADDCSTILQFPHGSYETGSRVNTSCLNGVITAGNLSRSTAMECSDDGTPDYCYYTTIVVRVTQSSRCKTLECRTVFDNVERSFGNTTISERTPRPSNLSTGVHSSDETIFIWNRPVNNCSDIEYRVSATNNCGSCSSIMVTPNNSITCRRILPEQQCNISVQSLTNCSTSEPETVSIIGIARKDNTGAIVGGTLGGLLALVVIVTLICVVTVVVIVIIFRCSKSEESRAFDHDPEEPQSKKNSGASVNLALSEAKPLESINCLASDHNKSKTQPAPEQQDSAKNNADGSSLGETAAIALAAGAAGAAVAGLVGYAVYKYASKDEDKKEDKTSGFLKQ